MNERLLSAGRVSATALAILLIEPALGRAGTVQEINKGLGVAGVALPERLTVGGKDLILNGLALRRVLFKKIYVAGLYLPNPQHEPDTILAADTPRTLMMHFLLDVQAKRLCEGWDNSLELNTPDPSEELKSQFRTLCGWMETAHEGERLAFMYVPGKGTSVDLGGKSKGPLGDKEFADALFRTWLGPKAIPGEEFKQQLLGAR